MQRSRLPDNPQLLLGACVAQWLQSGLIMMSFMDRGLNMFYRIYFASRTVNLPSFSEGSPRKDGYNKCFNIKFCILIKDMNMKS